MHSLTPRWRGSGLPKGFRGLGQPLPSLSPINWLVGRNSTRLPNDQPQMAAPYRGHSHLRGLLKLSRTPDLAPTPSWCCWCDSDIRVRPRAWMCQLYPPGTLLDHSRCSHGVYRPIKWQLKLFALSMEHTSSTTRKYSRVGERVSPG